MESHLPLGNQKNEQNQQKHHSSKWHWRLLRHSTGILPTFLGFISPAWANSAENPPEQTITETFPNPQKNPIISSQLIEIAQSLTPTTPKPVPKIQIEIRPQADPRVPADGRSTIKLVGRITDQNSQLVTEDIVVTLTTSAGKFTGADYNKDQSGFQILVKNGEFIATLLSDIKPQQVRIRAAIDQTAPPESLATETSIPQQTDTSLIQQRQNRVIEAYTQVEFTTNLRPHSPQASSTCELGRGAQIIGVVTATFSTPTNSEAHK